MDYRKFEDIFNKTIFEKSKPDLIEKIAKYPERYVGLFRPTKPAAKIIQNLLQSHEIRFGDAFEALIEEYSIEYGFEILDKKFEYEGDILDVDQIFHKENTVFFAEQKLRDDHDSSKKRGQIDNFEKKVSVILEKYNDKNVVGFFYFIDDSFTKNKNYYEAEIPKLSKAYGVKLYLCYGKDFFDTINHSEIWAEITEYLKKWKNNISDLPEINFDKNPSLSFSEIKNLKPLVFRKLFSNPDLTDLLNVLFPEKATLNLLNEYFEILYKQEHKRIYKTLNELCTDTIEKM